MRAMAASLLELTELLSRETDRVNTRELSFYLHGLAASLPAEEGGEVDHG
jgi:hypothetical protein